MRLRQQVRSQTIDHDLEVQGLVIESFICCLVLFGFRLFLPNQSGDLGELVLLLCRIFLQKGDLFSHLLLCENVVLNSTLERLDGRFALFGHPARISFLFQICEGYLLDVQHDVGNGVGCVFEETSL